MVAYGDESVKKLQSMVVRGCGAGCGPRAPTCEVGNVYRVEGVTHRNTAPYGATCNGDRNVAVEMEVMTTMMRKNFPLQSLTVAQMADAKMTKSAGCGTGRTESRRSVTCG